MKLKALLALIVIVVGIIWVVNWLRTPVWDMINAAKTQKASAEKMVALLKYDHQVRRIDERTHAEAVVHYLDVSNEFNGWAGSVINKMRNTPALDFRQDAAALARANAKGSKFVEWAKATHLAATVQTQSGSTPKLPDWLNIPDLFNKLVEMDDQNRQAFVAELSKCTWRGFNEIAPQPE